MHDLQEIKILIADGHAVVATGIAQLLAGFADFRVMGKARSGEETFRQYDNYSPDIVLMDIDLPGSISGLEVIRRLRYKAPKLHIIILTNLLEEAIVRDALREGVISYLLKTSSADELVQAIRAAALGTPVLAPQVTQILIRELRTPFGYQLTSCEQAVLELLSQGLNNNQIAKELSISLSTVQFHVSNILGKLGVHNRIEAATFAVRHKLAS